MNILESIFLQICNMSITAAYVILAILLVRLPLRRAPKVFSYVLWGAAAFRLVCPVSFSSVLSFFHLPLFDLSKAQAASDIPGTLAYVPPDIGMMPAPAVTTGIPVANTILDGTLPAAVPEASINPMQIAVIVATLIWVCGIVTFVIYSTISFIRLTRRTRTAVRLEGTTNVYECDAISSPFVCGIVRPRIYLPFQLTERERACVLAHERFHIRHFDHLIKLAAYAILAVYWFHPLVWVAYVCIVRDMEMRCDEAVLGQLGADGKADYGRTLLTFAARRRPYPPLPPPAFGETDVKRRVKNVLRFHRPRQWVMVLCVAVCVISLIACTANPEKPDTESTPQPFTDIASDRIGQYHIPLSGQPLTAKVTVGGPPHFSYIMFGTDETTYQELKQLCTAPVYEETDEEVDLLTLYTVSFASEDDPETLSIDENGNGYLGGGWDGPSYHFSDIDYNRIVEIFSSSKQGVDSAPDVANAYDLTAFTDITPDALANYTDARILKHPTECITLVQASDGTAYELGMGFGGLGVVDMQVTEADSTPYLLFTFSWGSGLHRCHAGALNLTTGDTITWRVMENEDIVLEKISDTEYAVHLADVSVGTDFAHLSWKTGEQIGTLQYKEMWTWHES